MTTLAEDFARLETIVHSVSETLSGVQPKIEALTAERDKVLADLAAMEKNNTDLQARVVVLNEELSKLIGGGGGEDPLTPPSPSPSPPTPAPLPPSNGPGGIEAPAELIHLSPIPSNVSVKKNFPDYDAQFRLNFLPNDPLQTSLTPGQKWDIYKFGGQVKTGIGAELYNYYDRAAYLAAWSLSLGGVPYLDDYAQKLVDDQYNYILAVNYGPVANMVFMDGLRWAYVRTKDPKYLDAIGKQADFFAVPYYLDNLSSLAAEMDSRMAAYVLRGFRTAAELKAASTGVPGRVRIARLENFGETAVFGLLASLAENSNIKFKTERGSVRLSDLLSGREGKKFRSTIEKLKETDHFSEKLMRVNGGNNWHDLLTKSVDNVIASQDSVGSRKRTFKGGWPDATGNKPFMEGLLNEQLIQCYYYFNGDTARQERIVDSVKRSCDYMRGHNWFDASHPTPSPWNTSIQLTEGMMYQEVQWPGSPDNSPYCAPDLNNLIAPGFAWIGHVLGDSSYSDFAKVMLASAARQGWFAGDKQINELFGYTHKAFAWME